MSSNRFKQERKQNAVSMHNEKRDLLSDHYQVPINHIIHVEIEKRGEYNTGGEFDTVSFIDYAGIDWIIDNQPYFMGVGDRIRPYRGGQTDFSIRVENGVEYPCESERWKAAMKYGGLYPKHILFGVRYEDELKALYLLRTGIIIEMVNMEIGEVHKSGDSTAARYIPIEKLIQYNAVVGQLI